MKNFEIKINNRVLNTSISDHEQSKIIECLNTLLGVDLTDEMGEIFLAEVNIESDDLALKGIS